MHIHASLLLSALILFGLPSFVQAFDFDDLEKLEKAEQEDLLAKAGQAARNWNFSSARSLLKQAQQKGYAPTEIQAVEKLIAQNESAKADKERHEEEARQAQLAAQEAERLRADLAAIAAIPSSSIGGGGGSSARNVFFRADIVGGFLEDVSVKKICVHRGSGNGAGQGYISRECDSLYVTITGNGTELAGNYSWTVQFGSKNSKTCGGTINISGTKENVLFRMYDNCKDAGSREY